MPLYPTPSPPISALMIQANRDLMEHSIKLGDCLGKGAFGSVYRVRFDLVSIPNG
jgi:hypothetical protein